MHSIELLQENDCLESRPNTPAVELLLSPLETEVGGLTVRRCLPYTKRRMVGPWIFFDHIGPVRFSPGQGIDVDPHPHIQIATVTYLFEGELLHRDSLGTVQPIQPGAVNLMVAGSGITHSECTPPDLREAGHHLQGLQLWLALPKDSEETAPAFFHYAAPILPKASHGSCEIRVLIGEAFGMLSPVRSFSPTLFAEALMKPAAQLQVPWAEERAIYIASGKICIEGSEIHSPALACLTPHREVTIQAIDESRVVFLGGSPVGKRHMYWNFVSSDKARIEQARIDWELGRFPQIPMGD